MREYAYAQASNEPQQQDVTLTTQQEQLINEINALKVVIVGGNIKWQQKMQLALPNAKMIQIDKTGSFSALSNKGTIAVINTLANKHANYDKLLQSIHTQNRIIYLNSHVNVPLTIKELHHQIFQSK